MGFHYNHKNDNFFPFPLDDHDDSIFITLATKLFEVLFSVLRVLFHDD